MELGVIWAIVALLSWGFGDFFIQKSVRKLGSWEALFIITLFGGIILTPLVLDEIGILWKIGAGSLLIVAGATIICLFAAFMDLEALRLGKLTVVEPLWSLEIVFSATLAYLVLGESLSVLQILMIFFLICGLVLVTIKSLHSLTQLKKSNWEKGVFVAVLAAFLMGCTNFIFGWGARVSTPLLINWISSWFLAIVSFVYLLSYHKFDSSRWIKSWKVILPMAILDTIAWVAFAFALILSPIGIVVALSQSYVLITVLLGIFINKERIRAHQVVGFVVSFISAFILAMTIG